MSANKGAPVRFSLITVGVWLLVAGGIIFLLWQVIARLSTHNLPLSTPAANLTQVYQTFAAVLTAQPSSSPPITSLTGTPSQPSPGTQTSDPTYPTPLTTSTARMPTATGTALAVCNRAAAGNPIDVTIPDDSLITPGQSFTKTWKLVNAGTCSWTTAYSANFFYGDQMGAPESILLQEQVPPDHSVEISVEMVAPLVPGTYQGNWKLSDPTGVLFGIGPVGDSPFWVRIIVAESPTVTPTVTTAPTATPTGEFTSTPTPIGQRSGELSPIPGDSIDLDELTLNSGDGDLLYQVDANQFHWLAPQGTAMIGVFDIQEPSLLDCTAASMSPAPIAIESLSIGTYLCYYTGEGRFGRMQLAALDPDTFALTLDLLTWALP